VQFFLDQYTRSRDQGLDYLKVGDRSQARHHLLQAARYLLEAARRAEPALQAIRRERALKLRDMALSLPDKVVARTTPAQDGAAGGGTKAEEDGLTSESKWLLSERPSIRFSQIAGLDEVKEAIDLRLVYPFRHPDVAERFKKRAGGGLLLYGPPGTGKTMIAKAVATELDAQFLSVKCSSIMSQWVGVAERNIAKLFEVARRYPVAVVFLDETEALVGKRGGQSTVMNRVIPEFLAQVDGVEASKNAILLLGATNRPWDMDEAALRTGRFGEKFYVDLPTAAAREQILHFNLDGIPMENAVDLAAFAQLLDGYSGADILGVCRQATDYPFHRQILGGAEAVVTADDLERARRDVPRSVTPEMISRYQRFAKESR
jgi:transitional endoplasmic reticulum ATPase